MCSRFCRPGSRSVRKPELPDFPSMGMEDMIRITAIRPRGRKIRPLNFFFSQGLFCRKGFMSILSISGPKSVERAADIIKAGAQDLSKIE